MPTDNFGGKQSPARNEMNNTTTHNLEMDEIFAAWSEDRESGSPRPLKEWIAISPQYASQLAQWATTTTLLEFAPEPTITPEMEAETHTIGRNVLAEARAKYETTLPAIVGINATAKAKGLSWHGLAQSLGLSSAILQKLDLRQLRYESLPAQLFASLAEILEVSTAQLRNYLQFNSATLAQGVAYKSDNVPQVAEQKDFAAVIQADMNMTPEQKAAWLEQE